MVPLSLRPWDSGHTKFLTLTLTMEMQVKLLKGQSPLLLYLENMRTQLKIPVRKPISLLQGRMLTTRTFMVPLPSKTLTRQRLRSKSLT